MNCGGGQAKYNVKSISVLHFEERLIKWEFAQFGGQPREKDLIVWQLLKGSFIVCGQFGFDGMTC